MKRLSMVLVGLLACGGGETEPVEDLDAELREATTISSLCLFVSVHPDTPQAALARQRAATHWQGAAERWSTAADQRSTHPVLREFVDAVIARGAANPCDRIVNLHVERTIGAGVDPTSPLREIIQHSPDWPSPRALAASVTEALREMEPNWLAVSFLEGAPQHIERAADPTIVLRYEVEPSGYVGNETNRYPALHLTPTLDVFVPTVLENGVASGTLRTATGAQIHLSHGFTVRYYAPSAQPASLDAVAHPMIQMLAAQLARGVQPWLGLASPDPAMAPFAGHWAIEPGASADGCGGEIVLAAQNITVNAANRTMVADVVDRMYSTVVADGILVAEVRQVVEGACPGSSLVERWELQPEGAGLTGKLMSTWLLPPNCNAPCTITFRMQLHR